ncbi:hypothetical protein LOC68_26010 [Blastopirellula sp. JC732]|uniref:Uncharacterized protein n=2 Tax=Blastopirellula sediminis TaxID=2894196 RepID=A0A9X1MS54_9BACT|nr:hypothetical protein [Blastopirellula sediminis]MCC9604835.1 hypothetical protein [Blastopirellula sediminis]MCC9631866.1 hypothetical protein [Blastopirellula sediminis]
MAIDVLLFVTQIDPATIRAPDTDSPISQWILRMHTLDLLEQAITTAEKLGYRVRREWLGGDASGGCEIAGQKWIFVDLSLDSHEQLMQVLDAVASDEALATIPLPKSLETLTNRSRKAA